MRTLLVIPAFEEENSLADVLTEVKRELPSLDILVIDDGSTDHTAAVARKAGALVCSLPFNLGVGGALRTGFRYAMLNGYDSCVQLDADGQHLPSEVPVLLAGLNQGADLVIGNRFGDGVSTYTVGIARGVAMSFLRSLVRVASGEKIQDTTSGFRAFGPRSLKLLSSGISVEYMGDTVEALLLVLRAGLIVEEVPTGMRQRAAGRPSQRSFRLVYRYLCAVLVIFASAGRPVQTTGD